MTTDARIGIDFGGTKIEIIVLARDGSPILRRRVANPRSYEAALLAVVGLVTAAEAELGMRCSVGVGIPGAISPATGLRTMRIASPSPKPPMVPPRGKPWCSG